MNKSFKPSRSLSRSFTLVELIIVVIIVGILASLGLTQYSAVVEKSRLAEARLRIGVMRNLSYDFYFERGTTNGITSADVGISSGCSTDNYFQYFVEGGYDSGTRVKFIGRRCTSGGKPPNVASECYICTNFYPATGVVNSSGCSTEGTKCAGASGN